MFLMLVTQKSNLFPIFEIIGTVVNTNLKKKLYLKTNIEKILNF